MTLRLSLIGFGEAGSSFAIAAGWGRDVHAFDIAQVNFAAAGVTSCDTLAEAVANSPVVLSMVTADAAITVAREAALSIAPGTLYFDMNSVSPGSKREAAQAIEAVGSRYVDAAIMAPVNPQLMAVPLLLSGPHAVSAQAALTALGFANIRIVGDDVGRASTIKMLRSVMYKGVEALTAECLMACEKAGVTEEVLGSFGNDWSSGADYRLDRMLVHGERRSAEMAESAKTLSELGIEPLMTRGTVERQRQIGALNIKSPPDGLDAKLERLSKL
jgi:3-hydroxyisobutyrate dehydrogenase-like beta-hydroxyacid dehydrogenase